jgi:acetyl-CoA carboxylase biotin carboxyl carrier protein
MADDKLIVDADLVRALAALLDETQLSEIEYSVGEKRVRVVRAAAAAPAAIMASAAPPIPAAGPAVAEAGVVPSPMVGTVYLSPEPDAPPFVKPGDTVRQGQALLIIEAMKVMNQIASPRDGRVKRILVADGAPVEYGQPLLVIE